MSIIVARKYKDYIEIGCDSQTSWGRFKLNKDSGLYKEASKVIATNGLVIGIAGDVRESNFLQLFVSNHKPKTASEGDILDFLVEFQEWIKTIDPNAIVENHLLVVYQGKLFQCIGFDVAEVSEFNAVGSGMFLAIGALSLGASVKQAIEVAKKHDLYCGGKTYIKKIKYNANKK